MAKKAKEFTVKVLQRRSYKVTYSVKAMNEDDARDKALVGDGEELSDEFLETEDLEVTDVEEAK